MILLPALFAFAASAVAAPPSIEVKVSEGARLYSRTIAVQAGGYQHTEAVPRGGADRVLMFDYTMKPEGRDFRFDFFLQLSVPGGGRGMSQSGSVVLRRGPRKRVLDCGRWKVDLALDPGAKTARGEREPVNYWLSSALSGAFGPSRCRFAVGLAQRNGVREFVTEPPRPDQRSTYSIGVEFPTLRDGDAGAPPGGTYGMSYGVEAGRGSMTSGTNLELDRPKTVSARGARAEFRLTRDGAPASGPAPAAPEPEGNGVVPLLR